MSPGPRRRRRRHRRRLGRLVRQPHRRPRDGARTPHGRPGSVEQGGRHRARAGRHAHGGGARALDDRLLRAPALADRHRLRLPPARLSAAGAHRRRGRRGPPARGDAAGRGPRRALGGSRRGRGAQPDARSRRIRGGELLPDRGLHRPAAQRARLRPRAPAGRGGAARALRVRGAARGGRARGGRARGRRGDRLLAGDPHRRARRCATPPAGSASTCSRAGPATRWRSPRRTRPSRGTRFRWCSTWAPGVYWRQEEDGLLFGWSDPDERPGEAREVDWSYMERVRARLAATCPPRPASACARCGPPRSTTPPTTSRSWPRPWRAS